MKNLALNENLILWIWFSYMFACIFSETNHILWYCFHELWCPFGISCEQVIIFFNSLSLVHCLWQNGLTSLTPSGFALNIAADKSHQHAIYNIRAFKFNGLAELRPFELVFVYQHQEALIRFLLTASNLFFLVDQWNLYKDLWKACY